MFFFIALIAIVNAKSSSQCASAYCSACDATQCTQCIDNYVLVNGECKYCRDIDNHCRTAKNNKCVECFVGYYAKNGVCVEKDPFCEEYEHGVCDECIEGYALVQGSCVACAVKGCEECDRDVNRCEECMDGYVLVNNECIQPVPNCDEYRDGTQICEECIYGYYLKNGQCVKISEDNCREYVNGVCTKCFGPYIPINGTCTETEGRAVVIEHCIEYDEDGEFECEECEPGYYPSPREDECLKCDPSCKTCDDSATECESCAEGFYVNEQDRCVACKAVTELCSEYKSEETCYQCNHKCNWNNHKCVESHCSLYEEDEDEAKCVRCEPGYVLDTKEMICIESADGCKTVENQKCVECYAGYFITADFKCEKCSDDCKTCSHSATSCHSCFNSTLSLSTATCRPCADPKCLECPFSINQCTKCIGNYTIGDVGDCVMGCFSEDCDGKCTMCADDENSMNIYYPPTNEGVCLKYSQMPNTPDSAYPILVLLLALLFLLI